MSKKTQPALDALRQATCPACGESGPAVLAPVDSGFIEHAWMGGHRALACGNCGELLPEARDGLEMLRAAARLRRALVIGGLVGAMATLAGALGLWLLLR